jgi:hypothetical protein
VGALHAVQCEEDARGSRCLAGEVQWELRNQSTAAIYLLVYNHVRAPYIVRSGILPAEAYGVMRGLTYSGVQLTHSFAWWGRSMI